MQILTRRAVIRLGVGLVVGGLLAWFAGLSVCRCRGRIEPVNPPRQVDADRLRSHVRMLAETIGPRSVFQPNELIRAAAYIESTWRDQGYQVNHHTYEVNAVTCANLEIILPGRDRADEIVLVGAHYDTVGETPGANDNGSGVAALLELARLFAGQSMNRTVRFVAFVNEEPPFFETPLMGSRVYAREARARGDNIQAMLSLETIGFFDDTPGSQHYPSLFRWFYPDRGNFIAFVSNLRSRSLLRRCVAAFRGQSTVPVECAALPPLVPGVGWSDHASFWLEGYPAVMVTDTAPYRYPHYHLPDDRPAHLDYETLAEVVAGIGAVVAELSGLP